MAFDPASVVGHYGDPRGEARACRTGCALFDFSFVAGVRLEGPQARAAIATLTRRPLGDLSPGQVRYALREDENGYLVSDLTVWRHQDHYTVMSGRAQDITDLLAAAPQAAWARDLSGTWAIFAVQGPGALAALSAHMDVSPIASLAYFTFTAAAVDGVPCLVGRLGYTGEAGVEIVLPRAEAPRLWGQLARSARPAGFVAADMLRIEAGFVLFANEFQVPVTATEAGLARFSAPSTRPAGPEIALVCFEAQARAKPALWQPAGPLARPQPGTITVTSACDSLAAGGTLGLGFALREDVRAGAPLDDPCGTFADIRLVSLPYFDPHKQRPRAPWAETPS